MDTQTNEVMCPTCNVPMQDGACPQCGMKAEDIKPEAPAEALMPEAEAQA